MTVKVQTNVQGKVYYTNSGKVLLSNQNEPVINSLSVTPTTLSQTITAPSGVDGYSPINVAAVTSSIDNNITANNIVSGVSILGVNGSAERLNATTGSITPTTSTQTVTPSSPYNGFSSVTVAAVTSSIDSNITASNIKKDVQILGVTGTYEGSGGGGVGITREVSQQGVYQVPSSNFTFSLPSNATDVNSHGLQYAFYKCISLTSVDLSFLTSVSGEEAFDNAFQSCVNLTSVDLSSLITVSGYYAFNRAFTGCTRLTNVNLSALTTISGNFGLQYTFQGCRGLTSIDLSSLTTLSNNSALNSAFYGCTNLTSVDLTALTTVTGNSALSSAFYNCTNLTSVNLSSLTTLSANNIFNSAFNGCTNLANIYFPALTTTTFDSYVNQFNYMMSNTGSTTTHTIHFPSNLETTIAGLSGYPTFGGTSGYVVLAFDLPATS